LPIIRQLLEEGAKVQAYDPQAMEKAKPELRGVTFCRDMYDAATGADAIAVLTEWDEFQGVQWDQLLRLVDRPLIVDGRNMFSPEQVTAIGFQYIGIGGLSAMPDATCFGRLESSPHEVLA
jgi:UDPglucose 6-dehydrogenase